MRTDSGKLSSDLQIHAMVHVSTRIYRINKFDQKNLNKMNRNTKSHISMRGGPEVRAHGVGEDLGCSEAAQAITEAGGTEGCWGGGLREEP